MVNPGRSSLRNVQEDDSPQSVERAFAERLRVARGQHQLTQEELATRLKDFGVTLHSTAITRIEKGERGVRLGEASAIARVLDVALEELLRPVDKDRRQEATRVLNEVHREYNNVMFYGRQIASLQRRFVELSPILGEEVVKRAIDSFKQRATQVAELGEDLLNLTAEGAEERRYREEQEHLLTPEVLDELRSIAGAVDEEAG